MSDSKTDLPAFKSTGFQHLDATIDRALEKAFKAGFDAGVEHQKKAAPPPKARELAKQLEAARDAAAEAFDAALTAFGQVQEQLAAVTAGGDELRARALEAERRKAMGDSLVAGARIVARDAKARVEALEGALRARALEAERRKAMGDSLVAGARIVARDAKARVEALEGALRVAMEALESIAGNFVPDPLEDEDDAARIARAALELLRAHVEPTPLEAAVQASTEQERKHCRCGRLCATMNDYMSAPPDLREDKRGLCWAEWTGGACR